MTTIQARQLNPSFELKPTDAYHTLTLLSPTLISATTNKTELRHYLSTVHHQLKEWFSLGADVELLLLLNAEIMDAILIQLWRQQSWEPEAEIALLATGGYGRKALHPHSDIDITIVIANKFVENPHYLKKIQTFMTALWDSKLKIGHSVRSLSQSLQHSEQDQSVLTSLLESRLITGKADLAEQLKEKLYILCSTHHFISQKYQEYKTRYQRYARPPYTLEPDIKQSPGGMRDIQLVEWLLNFIYKTNDVLPYLAKILLPKEQAEWLAAKKYLNTIRYARHSLSQQLSDQLIFDCQLSLAHIFGSTDDSNNQAVSQFMHHYFTLTRRVAQLTSRVLQELRAFQVPTSTINLAHPFITIEEGEIKFSHEEMIPATPWGLLEIFSLYSEQVQAHQLSVGAQRLIEKYLYLIPENCQHESQYQNLFLRILRAPKVASTLKLLHQYEILSRYIPEFMPITGMMQYDLFHSYPVDQHTLFLVKMMADFFHAPDPHLFPLAEKVAKQIAKPEVLYLAGLFHDIGKGQGGHHEEIGAKLIQNFCSIHHYDAHDSKLMGWLVEQHLLLSHTAQHLDTTNPAVIETFIGQVGDINTLNHLYLLTLADIYATNSKLWTAWRSSLIDSLYQHASQMLSETTYEHKNIIDIIAKKQKDTLHLIDKPSQEIAIRTLWPPFNADYFLNYSPPELAQHVKFISNNDQLPIVSIGYHSSRSATEIFIYTTQQDSLFYAITSLLDKLQLSIVAAHIHTTKEKNNLSTYIVLQRDNKPLEHDYHIERVKYRLREQLQHIEHIPTPTELKNLPTRLSALNYPTLIEFEKDTNAHCTLLRLFTADRPSLLAHIAHVCLTQKIQILRAQINTLAERAEDIFWVLNANGELLTPKEQNSLRESLHNVLG